MVEQEALDRLEAKADVPLAIVTAAASGERAGCVVGYWTRCSIDPPRFLVCISKANHTFKPAMRSEWLVLHLVPRTSVEIVRLFGSETGDEIDKFSHCEWSPGPGGVPILAACPTHVVCRVLERVDSGDHVTLLTEPEAVSTGPETEVFTRNMAASHHIEPGHPA